MKHPASTFALVLVVAVSGCRGSVVPVSDCLGSLQLASLPDLNSGRYKASVYISAAALLQEMGRKSACQALSQAGENHQNNQQVVVLCRMLFTERANSEFRRPKIGGASFLGDTDYPDWPLEPIELVDGVPFLITQGYLVFGWPEPADEYLRYCMANCDWNTTRFREPTVTEKRNALGKLLASEKWRRPLNAEERRFLSAQICQEGGPLGYLIGCIVMGGSSKAEEKAQPKAFNSQLALDVYAVIGGASQLVGTTPSEQPLTIPPCQWWFIDPQRPVDLEKVRQEVEAQGVPGLKLSDATDADLEHLKGLTALQWLNVWGTQVTDAGLEQLKGLTGLQYLHLWATKTTDAGLEHVKGLTALQSLNLSRTQVTDAGLEYLKGLTALRYLYLADTKVTGAGLEHMKGLTALQYLDLTGTQVTEAGVEQLKRSLPRVFVRRWRAAE